MEILGCKTIRLHKHARISFCYVTDEATLWYHAERFNTTELEPFLIPVFVIKDSILYNESYETPLADLAKVIKNNINIATPIPIIFPLTEEKLAKTYIEKLKKNMENIKIKIPRARKSHEKLLNPVTRVSLRTYLLAFTALKGTHRTFLQEAKRAWKPFEEAVNAAANTFWTIKVNPELAYELLTRSTGGPNKPDAIALRTRRGRTEALVIDAKLRTLTNNWVEDVIKGQKEESITKYAKYLDYAKEEIKKKLIETTVDPSNIKIAQWSMMFIFREKEARANTHALEDLLEKEGYDNVYFLSIEELAEELAKQ